MEREALRAASRGGIWVLVGLGVFVYGWLSKHPILVRGTRVPFGFLVIGLGVGIAAYDVWKDAKTRRKKASSPPGEKDAGG